ARSLATEGGVGMDEGVQRAGDDRTHRTHRIHRHLRRRARSPGHALTYIDEIAAAIRRAVPAEALPDTGTEELFRMYAVLALAKGHDTALEDVHDAWSAWMSGLDPDH